MSIATLDYLQPTSPDVNISIATKAGKYNQATLARFAHVNLVIDKVNEIITSVGADGYQGLIDATDPCPIGLKGWYWRVDTGGQFATDGPLVESGDQIICTSDNAATGVWSVKGSSFMIVQKNMVSSTATILRTGTSESDFVSPKTLADAGLAFATNNILTLSGGTNAQLALTATTGSKGFAVTSTAQTQNDLNTISTSTAVTTSALMKALDVTMVTTGVSTNNMIEVARYTLSSEVKNGQWVNAVCAKIDFGATGYVTGVAGVVCAELDMPTTTPVGLAGTYTCFEAELNMAGLSGGVPISAMSVSVWGAHATDFDTNGYLFDISGVTYGAGGVFGSNSDTATRSLRIRVNGTPYYIMVAEATA